MFDSRKRYPGRMSVPLEADTMTALEAVAKDAGASLASVAREGIRRGLDPTREAWRKQQALRRRQNEAAGGGRMSAAHDVESGAAADTAQCEGCGSAGTARHPLRHRYFVAPDDGPYLYGLACKLCAQRAGLRIRRAAGVPDDWVWQSLREPPEDPARTAERRRRKPARRAAGP